MSVKKFRFVSPGVYIKEVDQSTLPRDSEEMGPVIVGLSQKGPMMRPVKVDSYDDFVNIFGHPYPGVGREDPWRQGAITSPTYAAYAAEAYFKPDIPRSVTFVRLGGEQSGTATGTLAGWNATALNSTFGGTTAGSAPGAYGLFVALSASQPSFKLGAVFYVERGLLALGGSKLATNEDMTSAQTGVNVVVQNEAASGVTFKLEHFDEKNSSGATATVTDNYSDGVVKSYEFSFDPNKNTFIRKVFNTNASQTNSDIVDSTSETFEDFWLGQTFENEVYNLSTTDFGLGTARKYVAVLLPLYQPHGSVDGGNFKRQMTSPSTGWVISQNTADASSFDTSATGVLAGTTSIGPKKLFKFHSLYGGEGDMNYKISIRDIKASSTNLNSYGSFTVEIREGNDKDAFRQVVESYPDCNLNPNSPNYIARRIGDMYSVWDSTENRYKEYNNNPNISSFVRVEVSDSVRDGGADPKLLPFGFYGPLKFEDQALIGERIAFTSTGSLLDPTKAAVKFTSSVDGAVAGFAFGDALTDSSASFAFPKLNLVSDTDEPAKNYFGLNTRYDLYSNLHDRGYWEAARPLPGSYDISGSPADGLVYSFIFSLDDIVESNGTFTHTEGSHAGGTAYTNSGSLSYTDLLVQKVDKFTMPLVGGYDGLNIKERNPFRNTLLGASGVTKNNNYAFYSIDKAIEAVSDAEVVNCNLMSVPGVYNSTLTNKLIDRCEERGDALAIIDLEGDFKDSAENSLSETSRAANVSTTVSNLKDRNINSSYGAAYFPWCVARDTLSNIPVPVPPSVVAMGVLSYSEQQSELWFAPAGFNRGGLRDGAAGITVTNVKHDLNSRERDKLYEANINPIAKFPSEGIVVFGQKTLQVTPSALDRINVRRLMIFVKKEISRMANDILFDQNVRTTWLRFKAKAEPFLSSIKTRFGLTDYVLQLDEETTTPELVDRNIVYAKVLLKPARSIEFIAIDFNIMSSGASFDE